MAAGATGCGQEAKSREPHAERVREERQAVPLPATATWLPNVAGPWRSPARRPQRPPRRTAERVESVRLLPHGHGDEAAAVGERVHEPCQQTRARSRPCTSACLRAGRRSADRTAVVFPAAPAVPPRSEPLVRTPVARLARAGILQRCAAFAETRVAGLRIAGLRIAGLRIAGLRVAETRVAGPRAAGSRAPPGRRVVLVRPVRPAQPAPSPRDRARPTAPEGASRSIARARGFVGSGSARNLGIGFGLGPIIDMKKADDMGITVPQARAECAAKSAPRP